MEGIRQLVSSSVFPQADVYPNGKAMAAYWGESVGSGRLAGRREEGGDHGGGKQNRKSKLEQKFENFVRDLFVY